MDKYLKNIKENLNTNSENVVVMGNESCDLDSAISCLVYAYFLYWTNKRKYSVDSLTTRSNTKAFIPVINVKRKDLPIKTEVVYFLQKVSISLDNLICRDEIDIESFLLNDGSKLILVDHHILSDVDMSLFKYVRSIFDHRPKDLAAWRYNERVISKISEVGSCSTLICSEIQNNSENYDFLSDNENSAYLLYGTIILDTVNLNPAADKARPLDFEMINILEAILNITSPDDNRKKLFEELLKARSDYSQLTVDHLLKRDLKTIKNVPISGLPMLVKEYLNMEGCFAAIESFQGENNYSAVILMGLKVENDIVQRDIAICGKNETREVIAKSLLESSTPNIGMIEKNSHNEYCRYFHQSNIKASRKQIIPILKSIVDL